jgi:repressor LexA
LLIGFFIIIGIIKFKVMKGLTKRQGEIIAFIEQFLETHRFSPSYREIQEHFCFTSLGTVHKHIQNLKHKGLISAKAGSSRSMVLMEKRPSFGIGQVIELPFIGKVSGHLPMEIFSKTQTLAIPSFLVHNAEKTYILKVEGDSLNEELMSHGDLLIVEARQEAIAGEIVIALINHHDTIIKKYYPEGMYISLKGNNPGHQSIILKPENIQIQGVLVGLIRLCSKS